jgi:hypothetical protein
MGVIFHPTYVFFSSLGLIIILNKEVLNGKSFCVVR